MRKIMLGMFVSIALNANGQDIKSESQDKNTDVPDKKKFALLLNTAQLPYQCYELNGVSSTHERTYQLLGAISYTGGNVNEDQHRNMNEYDPGYMKKASDKILGLGLGIQFRYKLTKWKSEKWNFYAGIGCDYYQYKIRFYENEYVEDEPFIFHYKFVTHKDRFQRLTPNVQAIMNYSSNTFFMELGVGLAYSKSYIPESLEKYRSYHFSDVDYGYTGLGPIFSLRFGAWLF